MPRNRKSKTKTVDETVQPANNIQISEEEQWRLINQTGILKDAMPRPSPVVEEEEGLSFGDEIFNAIILIIPFSFLLLMFEILIHQQYGQKVTFQAIVQRMVPSLPIMSIFVFYTNRHKQLRKTQAVLFVLSVACGTRMLWHVNRSPFGVNMQQCPPLATIWVYTIVQLDLLPAVGSLGVVFAWFKWKALKFSF